MKLFSFTLLLFLSTTIINVPLCPAESSAQDSTFKTIPEKVQAQIQRLQSEDRVERRNASLELWEMGKVAAHAVPYLIMMLENKDWYVRKDAIFALSIICDSRAEKPLINLRDKDPVPAIRKAAILALQSMKSKTKGACEK